jgi:hypothetical protein
MPNPAFAAWIQQDQALLSAFLSSSTLEVGTMIMFAKTSAGAWVIMERTFASQSLAQSSQLRQQLTDTHKLDLSAAVYYAKIKALSDTLTSIGQPLRPEEFQHFVLGGLDEEYDSLMQIAEDRDVPMLAHDLYARLLSTEHRLEARRSKSVHSANLAKTGGKSPRPYSPAPPSLSPSQPRPNYAALKPGGYPPKPSAPSAPRGGGGSFGSLWPCSSRHHLSALRWSGAHCVLLLQAVQ